MITSDEIVSIFDDIDNEFSICEDRYNFYITVEGIITPNQLISIENNLYSIIDKYDVPINSFVCELYTNFTIKK